MHVHILRPVQAGYISNEDIQAECAKLDRYAEWTPVVYRVSDAPPQIVRYGDLPSYVGHRYIWGVPSDKGRELVAERERQFRQAWG